MVGNQIPGAINHKKEGHQKQKGTGDETLHQAPLVLGNQTGKSPHNIWL